MDGDSPTNTARRLNALGSLECLLEDGQLVELRPGEKKVLTALALHRSIETQALIDLVWDEPPKTAKVSLQNHVARIRQQVSGLIETTPDGYCLDGSIEVDVDEFTQSVVAAQRHSPSELNVAAEHARMARKLWRGIPFTALGMSSDISRRRHRLVEGLRVVEDICAESELSSGSARIDELQELVANAPFREERVALLAIALHRNGQRREALQAVSAVRRRLRSEAGLSPSPLLVDLEQWMMADNPLLHEDSVLQRLRSPLSNSSTVSLSTSPGFWGRTTERRKLGAVLKSEGETKTNLVVVTGERGIGKSRFLQLAADDAGQLDWLVHSVHLEGGETDLLASFEFRQSEQSVVLLIDNLHQAEAVLVRELIEALNDSRLHLIVGAWPSDADLPPELSEWVGRAVTDGTILSLELSGWSNDELVLAVSAIIGDGDVGEICDWLANQADGHPLLSVELLRFAQESGYLHLDRGRWRVDEGIGVPTTVIQLVGATLARFGDDERRILDTAAVLGMRFSATEAAALEFAELDCLAVAEQAQLIRPSKGLGQFEFRHGLIRQAILDLLPASRRMVIHHRVVDHMLSNPDGDPVRDLKLADHAIGAAAIDPTRAAEFALDGVRFARASRAIRTAGRLGLEAFEAVGSEDSVPVPSRLALALETGDALRLAGSRRSEDVLRQAAELAEELDDDDGRVRAALALCQLGSTAEVGVIKPWVRDVIDRALQATVGPDLRASLLAAVNIGTSLADPLSIRRTRYLESEELIGHGLEPATKLDVLASAFSSLCGPDDLAHRRKAAQALRQMAFTDDPAASFECGHLRFSIAMVDGDRAELVAAHRQAQAGARALGEPARLWSIEYQEAMIAHLDGRLHQSELHNERALSVGSAAVADSRCMAVYAGQLLALACHQGRLPELAPTLDLLLLEQPEFRDWNAAGAFVASRIGEPSRVQELFDRFASDDFGRGDEEMPWIGSITLATHAVARIDDAERSQLCLDRLGPYSGRFSWAGTATFGPVDTALGTASLAIGDVDSAYEQYSAAHTLASGFDAVLFAAEAKLGLAEVALRRGDSDLAQELAAEVLTVADHYGAVGLATLARAVA